MGLDEIGQKYGRIFARQTRHASTPQKCVGYDFGGRQNRNLKNIFKRNICVSNPFLFDTSIVRNVCKWEHSEEEGAISKLKEHAVHG